MNIFALLQRIWLELQGFSEAEDKLAYLVERITVYFKWIATKIPIPAWSLGVLLWLVDLLYTAYDKSEKDDHEFWAGSPAPPVVKRPAMLAAPPEDIEEE